MKEIFWGSVLLMAPVLTFAQAKNGDETQGAKVTVQIIEEKGGDRIVEERSYHVGTLSPEQQKAHLDSLMGALEAEGDKRRITVIVEDGQGKSAMRKKIDTKGRRDISRHPDWTRTRSWGEFENFGKGLDSTFKSKARDINLDLDRMMADLGQARADIGRELNRHMDKVRVYQIESGIFNTSKTIKSPSITPNRPFDGSLNVKFSTREKGDVVITARDTKGKELGKKQLKDFEGEFVGQVKIKESVRGVVFVDITQNEDGVTQRVALPANE